MEAKFELSGREFAMTKVNTMDQFHVARRLGPLLSELLPALGDLAGKMDDVNKMPEAEQFKHIAPVISPVMNGLSKLNDKDAEFVFLTLLSSVQVHQAEHKVWAKVATKSAIAMQDLEFPTLMQVAGRAFWYNLGGFLASRPHKA